MTPIRSYRLRLYPNVFKAEQLRYTAWWYRRLTLDYCLRLDRKPNDSFESTAGAGKIANQAQARARAILHASRALAAKTGDPMRIPSSLPLMCEAVVRVSKVGGFDYWIKPPLGPWIPAKSHRVLAHALREGGTIRSVCQVVQRDGVWFAYVFVTYPKAQVHESVDLLGCDVGVNAGVARSDGYLGRSLRPVLVRSRERRAEQQRQNHRRSSARTAIKQVLDREAKRVVASAKRGNKTLVLESPKALANLRPMGNIGGWARRHFGERVRQLTEIDGVAVREVWPARTSITCLRCRYSDKANRQGTVFRCRRCGARGHADVVAARNLTRRARGDWSPRVAPVARAALQTRLEARVSARD